MDEVSQVDLITLRPLITLTAEILAEVNRGYISTARYRASKSESAERITIALEWEPLLTPYEKHWDSDDEELAHYQEIAAQGYSLAAYVGNILVGLALCEPRRWNGTLWVWEFHVAASYRRRGIGRLLMDAVAAKARQDGFRAVGLETQNTNTPAIAFYRSVGFEIDAIDLSLYTNTDAVDGEVAILMKHKLLTAG